MAVWKYQLLKRGGEIWLAGPEGGLYPEALGEEAVGKCGGARYVRSSCAERCVYYVRIPSPEHRR